MTAAITPPIRVAIVDDQTLVRRGIAELLALAPDMQVVAEAADGEEALRLIREHRPDVVLLDVRMPEMTGLEVLRELEAKRLPGAPIMLTTFDDDQALIDFLDHHNLAHGYTTYWVSFRLAFLSGERLQFSAALPPKPDLTYTSAYERLPAYRAASDAAERIAYISANVPELDAALEAWFASRSVDYQRTPIGAYTVYYDFAPQPPRPPFPFIAGS